MRDISPLTLSQWLYISNLFLSPFSRLLILFFTSIFITINLSMRACPELFPAKFSSVISTVRVILWISRIISLQSTETLFSSNAFCMYSIFPSSGKPSMKRFFFSSFSSSSSNVIPNMARIELTNFFLSVTRSLKSSLSASCIGMICSKSPCLSSLFWYSTTGTSPK